MAIKNLGGGRYQIRIDKKNYSTGARKTKTLTLESELTGRQLDALLFPKGQFNHCPFFIALKKSPGIYIPRLNHQKKYFKFYIS